MPQLRSTPGGTTIEHEIDYWRVPPPTIDSSEAVPATFRHIQ
jgi:hypothetical protein